MKRITFPKVICKHCKREFLQEKSNQKYCSVMCRTDAMKKRKSSGNGHKVNDKALQTNKALAQKIREANTLGISYGKLMAIEYMKREKAKMEKGNENGK